MQAVPAVYFFVIFFAADPTSLKASDFAHSSIVETRRRDKMAGQAPHPVYPGSSFVAPHQVPGRLQRVGPKDSIVQGVKSKLRPQLSLSAQLLSQTRKFLRHTYPFAQCLGRALMCRTFRSGTLIQAALLSYQQKRVSGAERETHQTRILHELSLRLAKFKMPSDISMVRVLPKNAKGKVDYNLCRKIADSVQAMSEGR